MELLRSLHYMQVIGQPCGMFDVTIYAHLPYIPLKFSLNIMVFTFNDVPFSVPQMQHNKKTDLIAGKFSTLDFWKTYVYEVLYLA